MDKKNIEPIKAQYAAWTAQVKDDREIAASARAEAIRVKYEPIVLAALADAIATRRTEPILIRGDGPDIDVVTEMIKAMGIRHYRYPLDTDLFISP